MSARLPANWRPPRHSDTEAAPERTVRRKPTPREKPLGMVLSGELVAGTVGGVCHLWKCLGYVYAAGCGYREFYRAGWRPDGKVTGEKCPRCWED